MECCEIEPGKAGQVQKYDRSRMRQNWRIELILE